MRCGECAPKIIRKDTYSVVAVDIDYCGSNGESVYWHISRTYSTAVDGLMWYVNSSTSSNPIPYYRTPNAVFVGGGFYPDGTPIFEVVSDAHIQSGSEILADYMDNDEQY